MRTIPAALLAVALASSALPALGAETPNAAALRDQAGAEAKFSPKALDGMFEGQFLYLDGREPGPFTISLQSDGAGRWKGMVRDQGGPQAKVVATWDGLVFQMSKKYPEPRPEGYPEWVFYVGTIKHDPQSGFVQVVGTWSIPGNPTDWGFFEIVLSE